MDKNNMDKTINITGTNTRYMMKKVIKEPVLVKKRICSEGLIIPTDQLSLLTPLNIYKGQQLPINQLKCNPPTEDCSVSNVHRWKTDKFCKQQINKKIQGYKQQDIKGGRLDKDKFITFDDITNKMMECELKCRYCCYEMMILYENAREGKQWTVDRIDNDVGHNADNFHLACLSCNLKRRKTSDSKFLFTKQLNIVKMD